MGKCRFRPTYKVTKTDRIAPSEIEFKKFRPLILSPCKLEALYLLLKVRQASRKLNKEYQPVNRILLAYRPALSPEVCREKLIGHPLSCQREALGQTGATSSSSPGWPRHLSRELALQPAPRPCAPTGFPQTQPTLAHKGRQHDESISHCR